MSARKKLIFSKHDHSSRSLMTVCMVLPHHSCDQAHFMVQHVERIDYTIQDTHMNSNSNFVLSSYPFPSLPAHYIARSPTFPAREKKNVLSFSVGCWAVAQSKLLNSTFLWFYLFMPYMVILTFESVDEILRCDHFNKCKLLTGTFTCCCLLWWTR